MKWEFQIDRRLEVVLWVIAFAVMILVSSFFLKPEKEGGTVRIGYVNRAEGIALTHLVKAILEERMNYNVELTRADPAPIFTALAEGHLDFFLDARLPMTHSSHMEKYGDRLRDLGYNYKGARIGLVVPAYVNVNTIPALAGSAKTFDGVIIGTDSGAGIMEATRRAIKQYNMENLRLLPSSGAAMTTALRDAVNLKKPIVVTGWKPHWMFTRWELKFLEDPKKVYGDAENIHTIARRGIARDMPEVVSLLSDFSLNDQQMGALMDRMNRETSRESAAKAWIENHRELVGSWLPEKKKKEE